MMNLSCTTEYVGRLAKISLWQTISRNKPQLKRVAVYSWLFFPCLVHATIHSQFQLRREKGRGRGQIQKHSFIHSFKKSSTDREILRTPYQLTSPSFFFFEARFLQPQQFASSVAICVQHREHRPCCHLWKMALKPHYAELTEKQTLDSLF